MIAVVHLVWGPLGAQPLRRFLASYRAHPAGTDHELVVVLNGVTQEARAELVRELGDVEHRVVTLAQPVQDIAAYRQTAAQLEHERVCFLNSYSTVLAPSWLAHLERALDGQGVAVAGATGSWASVRSAALNSILIPNPYRRALPARSVAARELRAVETELTLEAQGGQAPTLAEGDVRQQQPTLAQRAFATIRGVRQLPGQILRFPSFPAYHMRTNGFLVERALFLSLRAGPLQRKTDAYLFESGRDSFTQQVLERGLRALVVTRDGQAYDHRRWAESRTLWQGDQENLMIADNQTRIYTRGGIERRRLLAAYAWGPEAQPQPPAQDRDLADGVGHG